MASTRQQIIDALETQLKTIVAGVSVTDSNGGAHTYQTDIGLFVQQWRRENLGEGEEWYISLRDLRSQNESGEGSEVGRKLHRLTVSVDLVARDGTAPKLIREAMNDVCACIGVNPRLGGLARFISIEEENLEVEQTADLLAGTSIVLSIEYKTPLWRM